MVNERFRALRQDLDLTQADLAALTCAQVQKDTGHRPAIDAQAIGRIERGEITWPNRATREALRTLLRSKSDADLGLYPKRTRRDADKEDATKRRDFLALAGIGVAGPVPRTMGAPDIEELRLRLTRLRDMDNFLGGADTFRLYSGELGQTERLLSEGHYRAPVRAALASLAAEQAQQAGWAAFDAGHTEPAVRLYKYSRRAASEANDHELAANALIHIAYATATPQAIHAAEAACEEVPSDAPAKTRALLESRLAWSHAVAGDARNAAFALDRAREILAQDDRSPSPHWSSWVDATELDIMTGRVWAVLHEPHRAIPPLERALLGFPDHWPRDKALYLTWLADAHLDAGEAERAAAIARDALTLASRVASVRPIARVRDVADRLADLRIPAGGELAEHLATITLPIPAQL
jgi:transcriptional regulator with XRE-family HTH domain